MMKLHATIKRFDKSIVVYHDDRKEFYVRIFYEYLDSYNELRNLKVTTVTRYYVTDSTNI